MVDGTQLTWLFFRLSGRVSRAAYFLAGLLIAIVQAFLLYRFTLTDPESPAGESWALAFFIIFFVSVWSYIALTVKRLHDIGKPGIISVALFIPVVSIVAYVVLCLFPGDSGPNQYGGRTNAPA